MGYALIPPKFINADNPKNYHLFNATINNGVITISEQSKCEETANKTEFDGLYTWSISVISGDEKKVYKFYYNKKNDIFYFNNKNTARVVIAFFRGDKACGTCISTLYADN
ncbi:hypothetical protein [Brachyspira hyodysenteriae]|uniref:hypothetical protein n=1 Tax=Brachyspira hyodysenteriae TaxID=159 RepID=UPI00063DDA31|nr:hypothetical protein [Brachyspira hyodysenteriae]KLI17112.1 hypothetical protein SU45_06460 [Brachyspira hyodysenteriae]KLI33814.1 hypothetical protein SZ48_08420 [Brachyspira hyodysenteriae]KLI62277.1 hypothetical protein SZ46_02440 [Brachyspira hyodysenteriae]QTM08321.1 hypothetical protein GQX60_05395 [Brachyspira hyodysenteriae]